ncbi:helix-turn-helix domain-containing protein [Microbulbifer elongatus]|uniref:Helix-turn-helix domain-containing protein n=1 Tax=Microbulbifer elongatus TaxID=86173 RepID=A0ABT1P5D3_9GAMM|nr:helix-turn-helix domain-containing protein [Microbulbifer elongatus]
MIRAQLRWSQTESARKMNIEQSYLSKLENDQALPSADTLERVCQVYGVEMQRVLAVLDEQALRRKPELLALRRSASNASAQQKSWKMPVLSAVVMGVLLVLGSVWWAINSRVAVPEHELLSMRLEQVDGRQVIEMFAEFGGLKVSGLELVEGKIDSLEIDQAPWDIALAQVAAKLNLRAQISGGYVTLVPLSAESDVSPE